MTASHRIVATVLVAVGLFLICGSGSALVADEAEKLLEDRIPTLGKCESIHLYAPGGWWIYIYPNHDGQLGYGSSAFDSTRFPVEIFDFNQVYSDLKKPAFALGNATDHYSIVFHSKGKSGTSAVHSRDEKTIHKLFDRAKKNAFRPSPAKRFEELWKKYPRTLREADEKGTEKPVLNDASLLKTAKRFQNIQSHQDASWVFDRRWSQHVMPQLRAQQHPLAERVNRWIRWDDHWNRSDKTRATDRKPCKEWFQFVDQALSKKERKDFVLYGKIENLNREGECWLIQTLDNATSGKNQIKITAECLAYLDDKGELLLVWYAPDGRWIAAQAGDDAMRLQGTWKVLFEEVGGKKREISDDWFFTFEGSHMLWGDPRIPRNPRLAGSRAFELAVKSKPKKLVMNYNEPSWLRPATDPDAPIRLLRRPLKDPELQEKLEKELQQKSAFDLDAWFSGWWAPRAEFAYSLEGNTLILCCRSEMLPRKGQVFKAADSLTTEKDDHRFLWVLKRTTEFHSPPVTPAPSAAKASDPPAPVSNAVAEEPKQGIDDPHKDTPKKFSKPEANIDKSTPASRLRLKLDSFLAGKTEEFSVPDIDEVERGKNPKLPVSLWPTALEAVRKGMAKEFGDMTLKEDRRNESRYESHLLRYRHGSNGLDITLFCCDTPREAGKVLRDCDRSVSVKTFSTRPGEEFRLKGVGDEAYVYRPSGSVSMCYSNAFVAVDGRPADLKANAARVIANCLKNVAELATPKMLDPKVNDAEKAKHAARLVADYALIVEGVKEINEEGRANKAANNQWTVQYDKLGRTVTVHALSKDDADFKRLDTDANGQIDHRDVDRAKIVKTIRTDQYDKTDELKEAADLLRRIDKRIAAIKGVHAGLSQWNEQLKTQASRYDKSYLVPYGWSSGKLLQFDVDSITRRHRLVYQSREERCNFSIRVMLLTWGKELPLFEPPHLKYARARLFVDHITADEKLRKELVWIIQEELFKEPGPAGVEQRATFAATPLAHLVRTGKFLDIRWQPSSLEPVMLSATATIMRDDKQLMFLCPKMDPGVTQYAVLPVAVKIERRAKDAD